MRVSVSGLICVFAGNYRQYENYLRENGLTKREAMFATRTSVMGQHFSEIVRVGSYQDDPDYAYLFSYVRACLIPRDKEWFRTPPLPFTVGV